MNTKNDSAPREVLASRLGFLLLAAGCAIGLGNIWRFPYVTGRFGGGFFVLFYLLFLIILGFPIMVMELAVGRGGKLALSGCFRKLKNPSSHFPWETSAKIVFTGNLILLMFYTVVTGWLLAYTWFFASGKFSGFRPDACGKIFGDFLSSPTQGILFTFLAVATTAVICITGLRSGVERITKIMMAGLFFLMIGLAVQALMLPNASQGVKFFLQPDFERIRDQLWPAVHAAMTQAFFTLSLGIGSIAIFGSYVEKTHSLSREAAIIITLDSAAALIAGLIIFPCCFSFGVEPDQGPSLIFITLPKIFLGMPAGNLHGTVFFLFLTTAALTTLVAVTENLIAFGIDELHLPRKKSTVLVSMLLFVLSLPCIFGFNLWENFQPFGKGSCVLDLEDFIVSDNLLPLGALLIAIFCTRKSGWGYDGFFREANTGEGFSFPKAAKFYVSWILPAVIFLIWIAGLLKRFKILDI